MPHFRSSLLGSAAARRRAALVLILLAAAFFRFYRLDEIPPGVTHDEADTGFFVTSVYRGTPAPVDVPYGYAYKPFTKYSGTLFMALFGASDFALRLHAAFFGTLLVFVTFLWCREAVGPTTALGGSALMAISFWPVSTSRFALNPPPALALFTGAAYFLWRAMDPEQENRRWWAWGLFAILLAGSLYAYETAIAAAPLFVLYLIYLVLTDRERFRRHGGWFGAALAAAALLAAPHLLAPSTWARASAQAGPLQAAAQGNLRPLLQKTLEALGTYSFRGDTLVTYNIPGRPILDPVTSVFFYAGIALCLWRWRSPAHAFLLLWLVLGTAPSLVTGAWSSTLHSGAAKVPVFVLPALFAVEAGRYLTRRSGPLPGRVFTVCCIVWLLVVAGVTGYDYFIRWGESPDARAAYFSNLAGVVDYLEDTDYSGVVTLSSPFPDLPHDPFVAALRLHRDDLSVRWFDARRALVFPESSHALLIVPPSTPLAPTFTEEISLRHVGRVEMRPDDVDPYFDVFRWDPSEALSERMEAASSPVSVGGQSLEPPVTLGGAVDFLRYELRGEGVPGRTMRLLTFWRVKRSASEESPHPLGPVPADAYGHRVTIFAHLLDANNHVVAQEDRLDAPAWNWHAGEVVAQIHQLRIGPEVEPGVYHLEVGIYDNHDPELTRFSVVVDGDVMGDSLRLRPLEVTD